MRFNLINDITKAGYGKFCIAGMDTNGRWIRPIPRPSGERFWTREEISVPGAFIESGDVYEIEGVRPKQFQFTNHTEDFIVTKFDWVRTLTNDELLRFLDKNVEDHQAFSDTVKARGRSTCLVKVNKIYSSFSHYDGKPKPKMKFEGDFDLDNPTTKYHDYIVKDCNWARLLANGYRLEQPQKAYLCIGLATPTGYDGVEYPQVIGLHTSPEIGLTDTYPD